MHIKVWDRLMVKFIWMKKNSLVPICKVKKVKILLSKDYWIDRLTSHTRCRTEHLYKNWKSSTNTSHTNVIFGQLKPLSSTYPTSCKTSKNVCHTMITIFVVISSVMTTPRVSMNFIIKLWNNAMNIRWKRNTFACTFRLNNLKALHSAELKSERIHRNYLGNCPTALSAKPELSDWQGLELEADEMQSQILNSSAFRMWETAQYENFVFATFSENKNNCALIWYQSDTDCSLFFVKILSRILVLIRKWQKLNGREISSREHEKIWFSIHQQNKHGWPFRVISIEQ